MKFVYINYLLIFILAIHNIYYSIETDPEESESILVGRVDSHLRVYNHKTGKEILNCIYSNIDPLTPNILISRMSKFMTPNFFTPSLFEDLNSNAIPETLEEEINTAFQSHPSLGPLQIFQSESETVLKDFIEDKLESPVASIHNLELNEFQLQSPDFQNVLQGCQSPFPDDIDDDEEDFEEFEQIKIQTWDVTLEFDQRVISHDQIIDKNNSSKWGLNDEGNLVIGFNIFTCVSIILAICLVALVFLIYYLIRQNSNLKMKNTTLKVKNEKLKNNSPTSTKDHDEKEKSNSLSGSPRCEA
jgi:hypothetical protein